ncbi:energy-coupling factor ABC transporter permease [Methanobacterium petrolearium]|uniref:energy-coupling factor ABC transporter permease n=1 Tax=Methanobacterium petrolearium TaxID=710190 RepID=UPI001AE1520E|nr:energy-coupling factor ABC transporter permease [Methanobacterium petrolearium]MBP1946028.1 cobalt/nickel transport system permease protein [Methanobacterium petrolearium]BDZ70839.1 cobalt transporter CbiM [Methanobacterium petrolearium]
MNIPDGFIPLWQCGLYIILMFIAWIFTLKWLIKSLDKLKKEKSDNDKIISYVFLLIFLWVFLFIIQAFCIPVPFGVGISLMGAALVTIILRSPWGAVLVMSPLIMLQWLLFGDGGITTIGVNIINIGVIAGFTGFYVYKFAKPLGKIPQAIVGGWFAGLLSLIFASLAVSVEMWLAGTFPLLEGVISMGMYSAVVGIFEGIITMVGCIILLVLRSKNKKVNKQNS